MTQNDHGAQFKFGEGRISGWISVSLGILSELGVLCFHFPDLMTTPELRQVYTADEMRYLLYAGMIFSVAFGLVTFVLNRKKLMGPSASRSPSSRCGAAAPRCRSVPATTSRGMSASTGSSSTSSCRR